MLAGRVGLLSSDVLVEENDAELTEEEVDGMPDDLREIYEMDLEGEQGRHKRPAVSEMSGDW